MKHPGIWCFKKSVLFQKNFSLIWIKSVKNNLWFGGFNLPLPLRIIQVPFCQTKEPLLEVKSLFMKTFWFDSFILNKLFLNFSYLLFNWSVYAVWDIKTYPIKFEQWLWIQEIEKKCKKCVNKKFVINTWFHIKLLQIKASTFNFCRLDDLIFLLKKCLC